MSDATELETKPETEDEELSEADVVKLRPPDLKSARLGILGELWKLRKQYHKRQQMISKGYVQWYLIDDSFPQPRFVKPKPRGGGIPEIKHKGNRYLFPRDAMVPSQQQGMWTLVHKKGEATPMNLRDPTANAIPVDALEEYIQMRPSASAPSLFDKLDLEAKDALMYAIAAIIAFAFLNSMMGGIF